MGITGGNLLHLEEEQTANCSYPKGGVSYSKQSYLVNGSLVFQPEIFRYYAKSPYLRVEAKPLEVSRTKPHQISK